MRKRAIFLVISLASLSAVIAPRARAASTAPKAQPVLPASQSTLLPAETPWVETLREIVARLLGPAGETPPALVTVELFDVNGKESASFALPLDGVMDEDAALEVARFFSCRRSGRVRPLHPGVIAMLAEVGQRYPGHVIEIVSGFRGSREERKTSPHLAGRAIDLRVRGVKTTEVRDWLWASHSAVGIGYYPHHDYLHMDTRPGDKDTAWTQARRNESNDYKPRWARKAREAARKAALAGVGAQGVSSSAAGVATR